MKLKITLVCLIGLVVVALPLLAEAVPITLEWGSFDTNGSTAFGVYESDNATVLQTGDLAQFIWVGPNGVIDVPVCDGTPGGDDQLLAVSAVKNNWIPVILRNKGYVPYTAVAGIDDSDPRIGGLVYIRAWNDTPAVGTEYGNSSTAPLAASGYFNAARWYMTRTCDPTAVLLDSFEAKAVGATIQVTWVTASEIDLAGFNVWRSTSADGDYAKQNGALIPGTGDPLHGADYAYHDTAVTPSNTYYYKLETVSTSGQTTLIGPVSATPVDGVRVFLPVITR